MSNNKKGLSFSWQEWLLLIVILAAAFAVRSHNLAARSLWIDEGVSLQRSQQSLSWLLKGQVPIDGSYLTDPTPPVHPLLLAFFQWPAGDSVFAIRLLSVFWGLMGIALLFGLGRRLFGRSGGLAAAILGALSPYWVWYDQSGRPDSLLIFAGLLSVLALHRMLPHRQFQHRRAAGWAVATIAMLYTHPNAIWVLIFELAAIGWMTLRKPGRTGQLVWVALVLLAASPLVGLILEGQDVLASYRPSWHEARELTAAAGQETIALSSIRLLPTAVLVLAAAIWLIWFPRRTRSTLFTLTYLTLPALASVLVASVILQRTELRFLTVAIAPMYLLQGAGASALWHRWRPLGASVFLGAAFITGQWLYVQTNDPTLATEDLQVAADYVSEHVRENDVVILHSAIIQPVWRYYYRGVAPVEVVPHFGDYSAEDELDRLQSLADEHDRVWFLTQPEPSNPDAAGGVSSYAESHWVKIDQRSFSSPWLMAELEVYLATPPTVETLPASATPANFCWSTGLCLHGWTAEKLMPGAEARFTFYWSQATPTGDEYQLILYFQDNDQQRWLERTVPIFPYFPTAQWPLGLMLAQEVEIPLSPAFPPTNFSLDMAIETVAGPYRASTTSGQNQVTLGDITLSRPAEPIPADQLVLQYKTEADFGDTVRLLGYNLPNDTPRPGHTTFIDFYWQALDTPTESWQQAIQLVGADNQVWTEIVCPLGPSQFDLLQWRPGDLVWERVFLALPGQMPAAEYRVRVALQDSEGQAVPASEIWRAEPAARIIAGPAYLDPWPLITEHPPMPHQPDVIFGGARLWGYDIGGQARPGETITVDLVWRDELPMEQDYLVFVHLMNETGQLLAQSDGVPGNWTRPTSTWREGEFIVDQHQVTIPSDAPVGPVYLWLGLYNDNGRVPVSNTPAGQPADRTLLDILVIES